MNQCYAIRRRNFDALCRKPLQWPAALAVSIPLLLALLLTACGNNYGAPLNQELSQSLESEWAALLAANKITAVRFDGRELVVEHGLNGTISRPVHEREIPNYQSDPLEFSVRVKREGGQAAALEVYADLSDSRYRVHRVSRDVNTLLHAAMTLYLREINILEDAARPGTRGTSAWG